MWSTLIAAGSLIGLVLSLVLLAQQTRVVALQTAEVARQTEVANAIAGAEVTNATLTSLREVLFQMVERPQLGAYVYDGKPCPSRGRQRQQVLSFVETLADTLNAGMRVHRWVPPSAGLPNWPVYAWHMLQRSPTLQMLARTWPSYWPELHALLDIGDETEALTYVVEHRDAINPGDSGLLTVWRVFGCDTIEYGNGRSLTRACGCQILGHLADLGRTRSECRQNPTTGPASRRRTSSASRCVSGSR